MLRGGLPGELLLRQLVLGGEPWRLQVVGVAADLVQAQLQPGNPGDVADCMAAAVSQGPGSRRPEPCQHQICDDQLWRTRS